MSEEKDKLFSIAARLELAQEVRRARRAVEARRERVAARLEVQERVREAQLKVVQMEEGQFRGAMPPPLRRSGWQRFLSSVGLTPERAWPSERAPTERQDQSREVEVAKAQLERWTDSYGPTLLELAEGVAVTIEPVGSSPPSVPPERKSRLSKTPRDTPVGEGR